MPYERRKDLPSAVRVSLPAHAQDMYLAAYNGAWDSYADPDERKGPEERKGDASRQESAHEVAWAAVTRCYEKDDDGDWVRKE
ncbi:MAG: ChaB family protein [Trueperaceae bacterium]|nr:ChaB family protein [Trueperaceae bacterium]